MFSFLKKIAGGPKEEACGTGACSSGVKAEGSCSTEKPKKMAGGCGSGACHTHDDEDHSAPKGSCH
jgi:hypothetical protein